MSIPNFYGWPSDLQIGVNELFKMRNFINFDEFMTLFREKTGKNSTSESIFLKFKRHILANYGTINQGKKYPPPIKNKKIPTGTFHSPTELYDKTTLEESLDNMI